MVHANQLRLGNYLFSTCREYETIVQVFSIDEHKIGCSIEGVRVHLCYNFEDYNPIPLTSKMLSGLPQTEILKIESSSRYFYYTDSGQYVRLDYLHQLQNLYSIITGEELSIDRNIITSVNASMSAVS